MKNSGRDRATVDGARHQNCSVADLGQNIKTLKRIVGNNGRMAGAAFSDNKSKTTSIVYTTILLAEWRFKHSGRSNGLYLNGVIETGSHLPLR